MATNKSPIFQNTITMKNDTIVNADGTNAMTMFTAGSDGGVVNRLTAASDDTSAVIAVIKISDGSDNVIAGEVTIPIGAGTDGSTPAVNLLSSSAMPGLFQDDGSLVLGPSCILTVNAKSAVTAAKTVYLSCQGGSYSA